ncbi:MAG: hypothetical protein ACI4W2_09270, partial [Eubacterium sp.]
MKEMNLKKLEKTIGILTAAFVIVSVGLLSQMTAHAITSGKVIERDHARRPVTILYKKDLGKIDLGNCARVKFNKSLSGKYLIVYNGYTDSYFINRKSGFSRKNWLDSRAGFVQIFTDRESAVNSCYSCNGIRLYQMKKGGKSRYVLVSSYGYVADLVPKSPAYRAFWKSLRDPGSIKVTGMNGWHGHVIA